MTLGQDKFPSRWMEDGCEPGEIPSPDGSAAIARHVYNKVCFFISYIFRKVPNKDIYSIIFKYYI